MTRLSLAVVGLLLLAAPARAQDTDEQARIHFQAGTSYFQIADYESALREYQRAYDLSQRADLLYNLYLCHERLGNLGEAVGLLERYLAEGTDVESRQLLQQRLRTMRTRLAAQTTEPASTSEREPTSASTSEREPTSASTSEREPTSVPTSEREPTSVPEHEPAVASSRSSSTVIVNTGRHDEAGGDSGGKIAIFVIGGVFTLGTATLGLASIIEDGELSHCSPRCTDAEVEDLALLMILTDVSLSIAATAYLIGTIWVIADRAGSNEASGDDVEARVAPWFDGTSGGIAGVFTF